MKLFNITVLFHFNKVRLNSLLYTKRVSCAKLQNFLLSVMSLFIRCSDKVGKLRLTIAAPIMLLMLKVSIHSEKCLIRRYHNQRKENEIVKAVGTKVYSEL